MSVVSSHFPYLPVTIRVGNRSEAIEALIDTGFDGHVVLPPGLLTAGESPDNYMHWIADGTRMRAPAYIGTVEVGNFPPIAAAITILGDEPIVGRAVTDRFRLILDHGVQVIVEQ